MVATGRRGPERGIERLLAANRPRAAFVWVHFLVDKIRPALLFRLLSEVATGKNEPSGQYPLDGYSITEAFKLLDSSGEVSIERDGASRIPLHRGTLGRTRRTRRSRHTQPRTLHGAAPRVLRGGHRWVFKRSDGAEDPETLRASDPELVERRAVRGDRLLDSVRRIPGKHKVGEIGQEELFKWLTGVRQACATLGRQEAGDITLGELIANAPLGSDGVWPCEPVRAVFERMQSSHIATGIRTGLYNLRGAHWRTEGGDQEREIAGEYRQWATALQFSHPFVASIFSDMANSYDNEARRYDMEAKVNLRLR